MQRGEEESSIYINVTWLIQFYSCSNWYLRGGRREARLRAKKKKMKRRKE